MNRFIIVDGLPYLYADGNAYAVRWDEKGFTVGAEVELTEAPAVTYSELSILAQCHENLNSIDIAEPDNQDGQPEGGEQKEQAEQDGQPEGGETDTLEAMTVAELKAYAEENGIDLGKAKKKAAIIEAIKAAE